MRCLGRVGFVAALCCVARLVSAETTEPPLQVGISTFEPFVLDVEAAQPEGFAVELWSEVARDLGRHFEFVRCEGVADKLRRLREGSIDVAIGGITVTAEREQNIDFTYPHSRTGLDILVPVKSSLSLWDKLSPCLTRQKLTIMGAFLLLIVVSGHLIWLAERGREMFDDRYCPGVFEGFYWAIVTASTVGYGDKAPVKWTGRVLAGIVIIIALPMFAVFTAELASTFTVQGIRSAVNGPADLVGRDIGVVSGTTGAGWALGQHLVCHEFPTARRAYEALQDGELDAVVYDAPNLSYYVQHQGRGKVAVVGKPFRLQRIGFAVPDGSPLREQLTRALLRVDEAGEMARIRTKWLGADTSG